MCKPTTNRLLQVAFVLGQLCLTIIAICFPPPIGSYNTSIITTKLIDHRRLDPYAPTAQPRSLMISLFKPASPPACSLYLTPYLDPITATFEDAEYAYAGALPGSIEALRLEICHRHTRLDSYPGHFVKVPTYPLVLFSPGMGRTRLLYNAMAQQYVFLNDNSFLSSRIFNLPLDYAKCKSIESIRLHNVLDIMATC